MKKIVFNPCATLLTIIIALSAINSIKASEAASYHESEVSEERIEFIKSNLTSDNSLTDEECTICCNAIITLENQGFSIAKDNKYHTSRLTLRILRKKYGTESHGLLFLTEEYHTAKDYLKHRMDCVCYHCKEINKQSLDDLFYRAIQTGDLIAIQIAINEGANINDVRPLLYLDNVTPLSEALCYKQPQVALLLLNQPTIKVCDPTDEEDAASLLIEAVKMESLSILKKLLAKGLNINATSRDYTDALMYALRSCKHDMAEYILKLPEIDFYSRRTARYAFGKTPLDIAKSMREPNQKIIDTILFLLVRDGLLK